jgi:ferritin-like metal-binding protein YciE
MKNITNLNDLFIEQMREIDNAERQQLEVLQDLMNQAASMDLRDAIRNHLEKTRLQKERVEKVLDDLNVLASGEYSQAMKGLVQELIDVVQRCSDPEVRDAAIVMGLQEIEHFEIAGYGSICAMAKGLGKSDIGVLLHNSLEEEKAFDYALSELARRVNQKAVTALVV